MRKSGYGLAATALVVISVVYFWLHTGILAQTTPSPKASPPPGRPAASANTSEERPPIAFDYLPKTKLGYVDWVAAIQQGVINPRESLDPDFKPMPPINFDVVFQIEGDFPDAVMPHLPHTLWLDCRNCHPAIFKMQAGTNPVTMEKILQGEFCGRCHGIVAFPISDCTRCHSRPK